MELQIFQNAEFGSVRSAMINGEPFFAGKDVAKILGYADPNKAIAKHIDEEDKLNDKTALRLGQRGGWLINESGLYSLILSSKIPEAFFVSDRNEELFWRAKICPVEEFLL